MQPRDRRRGAPARGRRHAVLRLQRQQLPRRGARARRRAARRVRRDRQAPDRTRSPKAIERLRDHARAFFTELAFAHRGDGRVAERRARARDGRRRSAQTREAAADLTGALDLVEASRWRCCAKPARRRRRTSRRRRRRTSRRSRAAPASCATSCGSCCAAATTSTSTSSSSAGAASSCARRRSTSRRSSASCCSTGCGRRC